MDYRNYNDNELIYLISENNEEAYNFMYKKYKPLITKEALNFRSTYKRVGVEYDDLYQEGMYGLSEAIRHFDTNNETLFYTLASMCIRREMQRYIIKCCRYKNLLNTNSISYDGPIKENLNFEDIFYDSKDFIDNSLYRKLNDKELYNIKYFLNYEKGLIFEMKLNGFSNQEISILLDINYKKVDNAIRYIKTKLRKNKEKLLINYI